MTGEFDDLAVDPEHWESYLEPGEKLLWHGRPEPGLHLSGGMIFLSLFGLPFLAGGLFATWVAIGRTLGLTTTPPADGPTALFFVFGLAFTTAGIGLVFGPTLSCILAHRRESYAVTDRGAYKAERYIRKTLRFYPLDPMTPIEIERGKRADSIYFYRMQRVSGDNSKNIDRMGFENIKNGDEVYRLMRQVQKGAP